MGNLSKNNDEGGPEPRSGRRKFVIESKVGVVLGEYEGDTEHEAYKVMALDGGMSKGIDA